MRFVSHIKRFGVQCIEQRERPGPFGPEILRPGYTAEFKLNDITDAELAFANSVFQGQMNGVTYELDEVTPVPVLVRYSTYDSDAHEEEFEILDRDTFNEKTKEYGVKPGTSKALVEQKLLARQTSEMRLIEEVKVESPWPTYNEFQGSIADLVGKVVADGFDIPKTMTFERQNLNRHDVIVALAEAYTAQAEDTAEVVHA